MGIELSALVTSIDIKSRQVSSPHDLNVKFSFQERYAGDGAIRYQSCIISRFGTPGYFDCLEPINKGASIGNTRALTSVSATLARCGGANRQKSSIELMLRRRAIDSWLMLVPMVGEAGFVGP
jgi:hypothetical protein